MWDDEVPDIEVKAKAAHTATVFFFHGLGDTGHGWSDAMPGLQKNGNEHIKFVLPTAPIRPVSVNMGMPMPAWWDVYGFDPKTPEDEKGISASSQRILKMVDEEIKGGIPASRIVLGGFSQGGALALYTCLTGQYTFAGCVALSTWLPLHSKFPAALADKDRRFPILQCHGTEDPLLPLSYAKASNDRLKSFGLTPEFKEYPMAHSACDSEINAVKQFLKTVLPPT
mmetsp:Transcript_20742/g.35638  ORF Transcript_20742/g.35638 Transcript_20742/m.35638 type:complete len:226 (+) Transcript_20742:86-763(+)